MTARRLKADRGIIPSRVCDYESWPGWWTHARCILTLLACVYNTYDLCPTYVRDLLGYDDDQHVPRPDRLLFAKNRKFYATFHRHNAFRQNGDRKGRNIHRHP